MIIIKASKKDWLKWAERMKNSSDVGFVRIAEYIRIIVIPQDHDLVNVALTKDQVHVINGFIQGYLTGCDAPIEERTY